MESQGSCEEVNANLYCYAHQNYADLHPAN